MRYFVFLVATMSVLACTTRTSSAGADVPGDANERQAPPAAGTAVNGTIYRTVQGTAYGRAVVGERHDVKSVQEALQLTLHDVGQYFGAAAKVSGAYEDQKDESSGGATFVLNAKGTPIKGLITCKLAHGRASVAVVYIAANAPADEWLKLTGGAPRPPATGHGNADNEGEGDKEIQAAHETLRTYTFPDGSGSIGLGEGWHTNASSANGTVVMQGPGDAQIVMGNVFSVLTPNSPLARMGAQIVAPFTAIPEALHNIEPQLNRMNTRNGGPSRTSDNVKQIETRRASLPGGHAAVITFGITESGREGQKHYQSLNLIEMDPVDATSWMWTITQVRAPDASYARSLPVMLQMTASMKVDNAVVSRQNNQMLQAQRDRFASQQAAHQAQVASYDAHNKQYWETQKSNDDRTRNFAANQNTRSRSNDDFDEVIRGYRTVEDTQSGVKHSVDLGNVDKIVDDLNEHDPGRFKQIPLRDENNPTR